MTADLDRIEALAMGAKEAGTRPTSDAQTWAIDDFRDATSPDVILDLVARVRAAEGKVRSDALDRLAEIDAPLIAEPACQHLESNGNPPPPPVPGEGE